MCTVTFIPVNKRYYITSNRDEKNARRQAIPPQEYVHNNITLIYPKDTEAAGTWIAMKDNGDAAVLLNGALKKHVAAPPYRKSRGLVLLDIFEADAPITQFTRTNLNNIEPFTLVLFIENELYECRWDGNKKYGKQLLAEVPHIWSSSTLYDEEAVMKREHWFEEWLNNNATPAADDILNFHRFAGDGNAFNDLQMSRDDVYSTVSITGIEITRNKMAMRYLDIKNDLSFTKQIDVSDYSVA
jgi:uncharacterized protein with NRDE domain